MQHFIPLSQKKGDPRLPFLVKEKIRLDPSGNFEGLLSLDLVERGIDPAIAFLNRREG